MFCPNCGARMPDSAKYCGECGNNLCGLMAEAGDRKSEVAPEQEKQPKKGKTKEKLPLQLVAGLATLFVCMAIGAVAVSTMLCRRQAEADKATLEEATEAEGTEDAGSDGEAETISTDVAGEADTGGAEVLQDELLQSQGTDDDLTAMQGSIKVDDASAEERKSEVSDDDSLRVKVQFTIKNEDGEFLTGAIIRLYDTNNSVSVKSYDADDDGYQIDTTRDENGNAVYTTEVVPGEYEFSAWVEGFEREYANIDISESMYSFTYVMETVDEAASGTCGDDLIWVLYDDYTLTISGTGDMYDYEKAGDNEAPWRNVGFTINHSIHRNVIRYIVLEEGITGIGDYAFFGCPVTYLEMPDSITAIGNGAFGDCMKLNSVKLSENLLTIGEKAFSNARIKQIVIPRGLKEIGESAFYNCDSLASVWIPLSVTELGNEVFVYCGALDDIYYEGTSAQWDMLLSDVILGYQAEPEVHYEEYEF